jgi:hypothetical protein
VTSAHVHTYTCLPPIVTAAKHITHARHEMQCSGFLKPFVPCYGCTVHVRPNLDLATEGRKREGIGTDDYQ